MPTPTRRTSEVDLDQWNQQFRASPLYQTFMRQRGLPTDGRVQLTRGQQAELERELARHGLPVPSGMHIDQGGNLNQKNRLGKVAIGGALAAAATFGIPGVFPGLTSLGGGGAATGAASSGAASGVLPATHLGTGYGLGVGTVAPTVAGLGGAAGATGGFLGGVAGRAAKAAGPVSGGVANTALGGVGRTAKEAALEAALAGLAGLPGLLAGRQQPSADEQQLQAQMSKMLQQQQQRTGFQNPLYEAVTRMAYGLLPRMGTQDGTPYPYRGIADVPVR